jgi:hypothetical protein
MSGFEIGHANKYEDYSIGVIKRSDIKNAPYNPRKISERAKEKLKSYIRKYKLKSPLTWNKRTGNLVSGHRRLEVLDLLHGGVDYELTLAIVDEELNDEVRDNIFMNNPDAQGEFDGDLMGKILTEFPELDPKKDFGFEQVNIDFILSQAIEFDYDGFMKQTEEQKKMIDEIQKIEESKIEDKMEKRPQVTGDKLWDINKKYLDQRKELDNRGESRLPEKHDYTVMIVFNNNLAKWRFMELFGKKNTERTLSGSKFLETLADGVDLFEVEGLNES